MKEPKKEIYNDIWFFYKKYLNGDGSDNYWEQLQSESEELINKHKGDMFARELLGAVISELGRREK